MAQPTSRGRGRPRDPALDRAILTAAERLLREGGYAGMSLEAVAAAAGTTVTALRRRHSDRAALAAAVVDSLRIDPLTPPAGAPRDAALAVLENFGRNLERPHSLALLGTLLAEEERHPELIGRFRARLVRPRRRMLRRALLAGEAAGELHPGVDAETAVNLLIGSFYARHVASGAIPRDWPQRVLGQLWPQPPPRP
jgi:AcrR family transcriptional regulator